MANSKVETSGVSLTTVLVLIFTVLKLTNNIDWSWWWVFSPYWIPIALAAICLASICIFYYVFKSCR